VSDPASWRVFHGDGVRRLRTAVSRLEEALGALGAHQVHTPGVVPVPVLRAIEHRLDGGVHVPELREGLSGHVRGYLCPSGGGLDVLPLLRAWTQSYRELPMALFRVGHAIWPFRDARPAWGWEELVCVSGAVARPAGSEALAERLVEAGMAAIGSAGEWRSRRWWLAEPAMVLERGTTVLGVVQQLDRGTAAPLAPAYVDATDRRVRADVELFYISEQALLASVVGTAR
jgi:hypothetical protein